MKDSKCVYDYQATQNNGMVFDFSKLKGKVFLIVNTASKCGFTPQYTGLQELYTTYKDRGLIVIGFPCDQFAHQEPGDDKEIASFCSMNFGVTFPLMKKIDVNSSKAHPLYRWLKKKAPGGLFGSIKWNFTKFLVHPDGTTVKRFSPMVEPKEIGPWIEKFLGT